MAASRKHKYRLAALSGMEPDCCAAPDEPMRPLNASWDDGCLTGRLRNWTHLSRMYYREATALSNLADNMLHTARARVDSARRACGTVDPANKRGMLRLRRWLSGCDKLLADTAAQYAEAENSSKEASKCRREADMLACGMHRHFPDERFV